MSITGANCRTHAFALLGYAVVSVLFTWPLALHLDSQLPGHVGGDTGVYVWNLWVFRHEVLSGHFPLYTGTIFSLDEAANLARHNYTVFANLLAFPLLPVLGVVRTFNLLLISLFVLDAWAMFALARRLAASAPVAWLAGLLFAFSPTLVARSTAHASLVAAAPLPLFVLCLFNMERAGGRRRWAVAAGATVAWAAWCDPYYAVYCLVLAAWHAAARMLHVSIERRDVTTPGIAARALETVALAGLVLAAVIVTSGGFTARLGMVTIGLNTLYTPMLLVTVAVVARVMLAFRPRVQLRPVGEWVLFIRLAPYAAVAAGLLLAPTLSALLSGAGEGHGVVPTTLWRSSPRGVDLLSLVGPNPNLAWLPSWRGWLSQRGGGFEENVASLTFSALGIVAIAMAGAGFRPSRYWTGLVLLAAGVTLGPFVYIAGVNTCIPTPWSLLRYAPLIGGAKAPGRFAVLVMLAAAALFALAFKALLERYPARRRVLVAAAGAVLLFELCPAPRPLYSAQMPPIYDRIAQDPRNVRVLELPFGVRDGLSSYGDFSAASQFYQTRHEKPLVGGYKSRLTSKRVRAVMRRPVLAALVTLSEGRTIDPAAADQAIAAAPRFVQHARIAYVVIDRSRASEGLVAFALRAMALEKIDQAGRRELYRPRFPTATDVETRSSSRLQ